MADNDAYQLWLASPYGQVHKQAEKVKQNYTPTYWYNNPYKILDVEDIYHSDTGTTRRRQKIISIANNIFKSSWNMRQHAPQDIDNPPTPQIGLDVERDAVVSILDNALAAKPYRHSRRFTYRQKQALVLERDALNTSITPTIHIAQHLGINRHSAYKLLRRAKMETSGHENDIILLERKAKKDMQRSCCYCGKPTINGLRALCNRCEVRFYHLEDYPVNYTPEKLKRLVNRSNAEHWQKVKERTQAA